MTLGDIRRYYEKPLISAMATLGVEYRTENQEAANDQSSSEYAVFNFSLEKMAEAGLCQLGEDIRGIGVFNVYTPKGQGAARNEEIQAAALQALCALNDDPAFDDRNIRGSVSNLVGPIYTPLTDQPYLYSRLTFSANARTLS